MKYIDEKFKDEKPEITVKKIIEKLNSIGITVSECWNDSGLENCCSLCVSVDGGTPSTYGKGISKAFARASAYGEFIDRLQSGLFFYKYQSFENDESVFLHSYAPDKRYMTKAELLENSEWMEPIAKRYGITKENIANQCQIYACSDKILTLPFYSVFEDKYVYLPTAFVEHIYSANGCCVGNTREEAWVHALSEILERHSNIEVIKSGKAMPSIPREKLKSFKTVNEILDKIEEQGIYDVEIFDYSCGKNFPVIATRIINKKTKRYLVNVGADPVFEIAVQRTLTEIFQGRNLENFSSSHKGVILNNLSEINIADNIMNQLETGNGLYTVDFFTDDSNKKCAVDDFSDNSSKTNSELLQEVVAFFKKLNLPLLIRNNSFLGFPCYKIVVPGYSESRGEKLKESIPTYYFADRASKTIRNIKKANILELNELLLYHKMIQNFISRKSNFKYISGLPLNKIPNNLLALHFSYAALKLKKYKVFDSYISDAIFLTADDDVNKDYLLAVKQWVSFQNNGIDANTAMKVMRKFYFEDTLVRLQSNIEADALLDEFVIECGNCEKCKFKKQCCYESIRQMISKAGAEYQKFTDGQSKEHFVV